MTGYDCGVWSDEFIASKKSRVVDAAVCWTARLFLGYSSTKSTVTGILATWCCVVPVNTGLMNWSWIITFTSGVVSVALAWTGASFGGGTKHLDPLWWHPSHRIYSTIASVGRTPSSGWQWNRINFATLSSQWNLTSKVTIEPWLPLRRFVKRNLLTGGVLVSGIILRRRHQRVIRARYSKHIRLLSEQL